ncbi:MAG: hypothetical protein U0350_05975 [Caldilineaceae bacterium]
MIELKLSDDQASALCDLLNSMNIEPVKVGPTLLEIFDQPVDHPLWPVLKTLRNKIALAPAHTVNCATCGKPIERSTRGGKPRMYCNAACKQKAVRQKALDRRRKRI